MHTRGTHHLITRDPAITQAAHKILTATHAQVGVDFHHVAIDAHLGEVTMDPETNRVHYETLYGMYVYGDPVSCLPIRDPSALSAALHDPIAEMMRRDLRLRHLRVMPRGPERPAAVWGVLPGSGRPDGTVTATVIYLVD